MVWTCSENGRGKTPKQVMKWNPPERRKQGRPKLTWMDEIRRLMGGKGTSGRRLERQRRMEKEDTISVQWAQEDVETSYNLLNNNNNKDKAIPLQAWTRPEGSKRFSLPDFITIGT
jgi:hypothetical protein